ncbi:hypothetical protein D5S17_32915 [Pseudonocardiaceae bacterium YIM PH 21723]|nr:hypothetical protein D5S17_32915 [Pseudonocardiaceae bacterium YIM PH 21723]
MRGSRSVALQLTTLKVLLEHAQKIDKATRAEAFDMLAPKDRLSAVTPDGQLLGTVTMSAPRPRVTIDDEQKLISWLVDRYPDHLADDMVVTGPADRVAEVLAAYAPELVTRQPVLRDWARAELIELAQAAGHPVGPGGEVELPGISVTTPNGVVSVRLEPGAASTIIELIRSGHLAIDGTLRALEAGESDAA